MKKPTWVEFYHTIQCCYVSTCIYILIRLLSPTSATSPTSYIVLLLLLNPILEILLYFQLDITSFI